MAVTSVIPKIFQKADGGLLQTCIMCNKSVLSPARDYVIEKAVRVHREFKKTEVIFEYAMCLVCAESMRKELSEESRQRIEDYFHTHVDFNKRLTLLQPKRATFSHWIKDCLVTGEPIKDSEEFSLYGHAYGKHLVYDLFPYAISGTVMEEVSELLSVKTREVLDDFIGNHFSGPPEVAEILKKRPVLI